MRISPLRRSALRGSVMTLAIPSACPEEAGLPRRTAPRDAGDDKERASSTPWLPIKRGGGRSEDQATHCCSRSFSIAADHPICPDSAHTESSPRCSQKTSSIAWSCPSDRKSTRLNSSHPSISYAVFCLKKKNHPQRLTLPSKHTNDGRDAQ